jgi:FlaA1/EpsC-like NDP-sugar epimerase
MIENDGQVSENFWFLRRPSQFLADVAALCGAFFIAYLPAVNVQLGEFYLDTLLRQLPFVVLVQVSALLMVGAYSIIWRYVSIEDIKAFLKAAAISCVVLIILRFALGFTDFTLWQIPISVILIDTILAFGGVLSLRILRRFMYELNEKNRVYGGRRRLKRKPALIVGAGRMGATLVKEMNGRADGELEVRGFIDDDPRKKGGSVSGIKVLGDTRDLARLVEDMDIQQVVIAMDDDKQGKAIRRIIDLCTVIPVKAQIVPSLNEIAHGRVSVSRIRDVQIEDLLGRDPVELDDRNLHEFLDGKTVLVTGAGGSIGSEIVRQITHYKPQQILLVERAEYFLFQIERELAGGYAETKYVPLMADVGDEPRMRDIFVQYRPNIIFHAAAHKHVPLMETNSAEAVKNNIFATELIGRLAGEYGASDFVMISTDKAVNPTSIMGASKRIAEIVIQDLNRTFDTKYVAVRFGNVLGSAGSVVPIFREQIQKGEPITVTHKDMTRYFMTIPEASQLVMQAGALGEGGEIFILDMGEPIRILDLAEDMIRLSGLTPYEDVDIRFTGIRGGEKLFEELEITGEDLLKTRHPKIYVGKIGTYAHAQVENIVSEFSAAVAEADEHQIRNLFNQFLPEATITTETKTPISVNEKGNGNFIPASTTLELVEK